MLISLLVLAFEQIFIPIWVTHGKFYRWPITLLDELVVLVNHNWVTHSTAGQSLFLMNSWCS